MRLYYSPASPFVRKAMVVLHETGQLGEVALVAHRGTMLQPDPALINRNPLGKIPALERPGAATLFDSRVICRFLDARGNGGLYPAGSRQWESITLEANADGIMDASVLMVYEVRFRTPERVDHTILEAQWARITRALDMLESRWLSHLAGPFDIGQIAVACALGHLDLRHGARDWRRGRPGLTDWETRIAARPSLRATIPTES